MELKFNYKLTKEEKNIIAQNLMDILQKDASINKLTVTFIGNWILTSTREKTKAFYDVWEIVLKNYMPTTRPILFRACKRVSKNKKIASFTGRLECARRFSEGKDSLIICDTNETLKFERKLYKPGEYKHTFYPISAILKKAKKSGGCGFSEELLNNSLGEDEYIMRVDLENMQSFKWR